MRIHKLHVGWRQDEWSSQSALPTVEPVDVADSVNVKKRVVLGPRPLHEKLGTVTLWIVEDAVNSYVGNSLLKQLLLSIQELSVVKPIYRSVELKDGYLFDTRVHHI